MLVFKHHLVYKERDRPWDRGEEVCLSEYTGHRVVSVWTVVCWRWRLHL